MESLYAPWREKYIKRNREHGSDCVFCNMIQDTAHDAEHYIFHRDDKAIGVMNLYPYSPGHLLFVPHSHEQQLDQLDEEMWLQMNRLACSASTLLRHTFHAEGVNIGMNIGRIAGAGIAEHLHLHVVPRWTSDHNFITVLSDTRVYSSEFDKVFEKVKANFTF